MRITRVGSAKAAVLASALAAALTAAPTPADQMVSDSGAKRVTVKDNFFEPRSVDIHRGGRVTWVWRGENEHNLTFTKVPKGASKRGADARRRGHFTRVFRKRGVYKYVCTLHAGMRGSVEVGYAE